MTRYYINGDEVSERVFERERDDNFNLDIYQEITTDGDTVSMTYEEGDD